jgi:hypothetical protein
VSTSAVRREKACEKAVARNKRQVNVAIEHSLGFEDLKDGIEDFLVFGDLLDGLADEIRAHRGGVREFSRSRAFGAALDDRDLIGPCWRIAEVTCRRRLTTFCSI